MPEPDVRSGIYANGVKPLPSEDLEHVLRHTATFWERARGRRVFISGGTGFFGAWLLETLAYCNRKLNARIVATVLSRDPEGFARRMPHVAGEACMRLIKGDVRDFAFPEGQFEYVIHAAATTSAEAAGRPMERLSTLVDGTRRMLELAKAGRAGSFLYVSSGAVYGPQPASMSQIPEDYLGGPDWLDPESAYAEGKRVGEQLCTIAARETATAFTIARCFAFAGPHLPLDKHFAIGNFIRDALAGRNIAVRGDGTPMRSYLYGADLAIWLWTMLLGEAAPGARPRLYNVGSGEAVSIRELAQRVVKEIDQSLQVEVAREPLAGAPPMQYVPDVGKAERELGLRPLIALGEAIRRMAAWYR
jgi:nucleoside-diphosphate-sugar epimerase